MLKRLDEAAARAILAEAEGRDEVPPGDAPYLQGYMEATEKDAAAARKAILAEIEAMGWQVVPKAPPNTWPRMAQFDRDVSRAIEGFYPHKQADYAIAQRLHLVREIYPEIIAAAPKLTEET